jgi:hypothetical protein
MTPETIQEQGYQQPNSEMNSAYDRKDVSSSKMPPLLQSLALKLWKNLNNDINTRRMLHPFSNAPL